MSDNETASLARTYLRGCHTILDRIEQTQMDAILRVARLCADCIAADGLVHLFGSGHSRMAIEEIFPRYGSFRGLHPSGHLSPPYPNPHFAATGHPQPSSIAQEHT